MEIKRFANDLWTYMRARKKLWLLPIVVVLGGIAILFLLIQGASAGPSIYSIF